MCATTEASVHDITVQLRPQGRLILLHQATQNVCDYAATQGVSEEALVKGMEKAVEFAKQSAQVCRKACAEQAAAK